MFGIKLVSGHNDCYWNIGGRCTNPKITGKKIVTRDWNSKINCTLTQIGVVQCGEYWQQGLAEIGRRSHER